MIASLTGTVQAASGGQVVIDVSGVGYLVAVTPATAQGLRLGDRAALLISMIVREDAMLLYGFASAEERDFFDSLRGVSGVGPKLALAVLSALSPERIAVAVANEDDKAFSAISGIGPKTALAAIGALSGADIANAVANDDSKVFEQVSGIGAKTAKLIVVTLNGKLKSVGGGELNQDLLAALQGLGWPERIAEPVVKEVLKAAGNKSLSDLIRESLSILGGK